MTIPYELAEYLSVKKAIGAPVGKVWPVFLDMNRWYTDYHWDWISGPPYQGVGLQEGQVLKASPLYGVGIQDPTLYYLQEQVKVTAETEIVVKITAANPKSMSSDYATEVRDIVAFYHWDFLDNRGRTRIGIRSYSNIRMTEKPSARIIADLTHLFYRSWGNALNNLALLAASSAAQDS